MKEYPLHIYHHHQFPAKGTKDNQAHRTHEPAGTRNQGTPTNLPAHAHAHAHTHLPAAAGQQSGDGAVQAPEEGGPERKEDLDVEKAGGSYGGEVCWDLPHVGCVYMYVHTCVYIYIYMYIYIIYIFAYKYMYIYI